MKRRMLSLAGQAFMLGVVTSVPQIPTSPSCAALCVVYFAWLVGSGQGDQISRLFHEDDQISPLFHEGAQDVQLINLSILPPWVAGFRAAETKLVSRRLVLEPDFRRDGGPNKSARNAP